MGRAPRRFGRLPLATILAPAIRYAQRGFPVTEVDARMWKAGRAGLAADPGARATYLPDGRAPCGRRDCFGIPTSRRRSTRVADARARRVLSRPTAEAMIAFAHAEGNPMTAADLAEFQPEWVTPDLRRPTAAGRSASCRPTRRASPRS